jgi:hypothetical protein
MLHPTKYTFQMIRKLVALYRQYKSYIQTDLLVYALLLFMIFVYVLFMVLG